MEFDITATLTLHLTRTVDASSLAEAHQMAADLIGPVDLTEAVWELVDISAIGLLYTHGDPGCPGSRCPPCDRGSFHPGKIKHKFPGMILLLGKVPDQQVGDMYGLSRAGVAIIRNQLGIEANLARVQRERAAMPPPKTPEERWIAGIHKQCPGFLEFLGNESDIEFAKRYSTSYQRGHSWAPSPTLWSSRVTSWRN